MCVICGAEYAQQVYYTNVVKRQDHGATKCRLMSKIADKTRINTSNQVMDVSVSLQKVLIMVNVF